MSTGVRDTVFVVTNGLLPVSPVLGLGIVLWHRQVNPEDRSNRPTLE